jgi:hypothetical protein
MEERLMAGTFDGEGSNPAPSLTVGELEANYPLYCKAMRIVTRGRAKVQPRLAARSADSGWKYSTTAYLTSIAIPTISIYSCLASWRYTESPAQSSPGGVG